MAVLNSPIRGFVLQPTYRIRQQRPIVQLFGRLEDGRAFLVEDDRFRPYFFARKSDMASFAKPSGIEITRSDLCDFDGNAERNSLGKPDRDTVRCNPSHLRSSGKRGCWNRF